MNYHFFADLLTNMHWTTLVKEIQEFSKIYNLSVSSVLKQIFYNTLLFKSPKIRKYNLKRNVEKEGILKKDFARDYENESLGLKEYRSKGYLKNESLRMLQVNPIPHALRINDRINMAFSIESRAPFLDYRLTEFCLQLPDTLKIRNGISKYILRQALRDVLPEKVLYRKVKQGFPTPTAKWFRNEMHSQILEIFNSPRV
jgi:asparagine synthase (glutamine-hydrolysing)